MGSSKIVSSVRRGSPKFTALILLALICGVVGTTFAQRDRENRREIDVRRAAKDAVVREINSRYGRGANPKITRNDMQDADRDRRRVTGRGEYSDRRDRRTFNFACVVNRYNGRVTELQIDSTGFIPGRPGHDEDRHPIINEKRARIVAENDAKEQLRRRWGSNSNPTLKWSRAVVGRYSNYEINGEGRFRKDGRDLTFTFDCWVDNTSEKVSKMTFHY